jgi:hypothetical protein
MANMPDGTTWTLGSSPRVTRFGSMTQRVGTVGISHKDDMANLFTDIIKDV